VPESGWVRESGRDPVAGDGWRQMEVGSSSGQWL
jgi:hypothetical protein